MKMRFIAAAAVALLSFTASSHAANLRFAHAGSQEDLQQDLAEYFAKNLEERTTGDITVDIFPNSQLGSDQQMISGVRSGTIDIVMSGLNNFTGMMPDLGALLLPYMFTSRADAYQVLDGEVGQESLAEFENHGMKALGFPENGFRNVTNTRRPIHKPADMEGLAIRTNQAQPLIKFFNEIGANPQPIPVSELYTALETGVVDAQEHPIPITYSFHYDEVQDYLSLTQHAYAPLVIAMNNDKFDQLSEKQQMAIEEVTKDAIEYGRELAKDREEEMIADLKERGMEVNRDVNKEAFQKAAQPVWEAFKSEHGGELIRKIQGSS
ncbi:DctP family TRAP transporter solute-binding subunit [Salinisphaera sp. USBA-960]|uniref:DctP family TRAP transporter solute-binding subunit n=1 Tax=Salinisphaera orenii TaxID=856731 RepID=UPI000DBE1AC2|nr:DctP family TRAP transporter solute-binding subunit [Salifodinibacter halophilus]NNC25408.1 DctP family TRAP transporter solute-binding subunit [Salifodinibacter halophilus]